MSADQYVLLVEEDDDLRETLADLLYEEGYASCAAAGDEEALAFLRAAPLPCFILLDQPGPDTNVDARVRRLRAVLGVPNVPICLLTSDVRAVTADVDAILKKPIDVTELLLLVHHHCRQRATHELGADPT